MIASFYTCPMALRIKSIRIDRGLTQLQLAEMAGLSRSQLSEIETETKPANTLRLNAIAAALKVDVEQLFDQEAKDAYRTELMLLMRDLSDDDKAAILRMARAMIKPQ